MSRGSGGRLLRAVGAAGLLLAIVATAASAASGEVAASNRASAVARRTVMLGRSVEGRPISAIETGDFTSALRVVVVGCMHGDECAGLAVALRLAQATPPRGIDLWIVPNLNPDGTAHGTRGNAHGVDLNRNFPWRWEPIRGRHASGRYPLSERESRIAFALLERVQPSVSIWFHQSLGVVDDSGGRSLVVRRFAALARLPLATLAAEPGSIVTWQSHRFPQAASFVVELPAGPLDSAAVTRLARVVRSVSLLGA